jgi:hypothetical protein
MATTTQTPNPPAAATSAPANQLTPSNSAPQAIAPRPNPTFGLAPRSFDEAWRFAQMIAHSDLAPKDYIGKPANVMVAMQMGMELGLSPMAALQNIAVINGRPSLWGDAALAVVQAHPEYEWHKEELQGTGDAAVAVFIIKRKGHAEHTAKFSVSDAKKAGLWSKTGPWQTYPTRMLTWRARGFGLRDKFADALRGLITAEEAMDIPPVIDAVTTPADAVRNATQASTEELSKKYGAQPAVSPESNAAAPSKPEAAVAEAPTAHPSSAPASQPIPAPQEESFDPAAEAERLLASNRAQHRASTPSRESGSPGAAPSGAQMGFAESPEEGGRFGE